MEKEHKPDNVLDKDQFDGLIKLAEEHRMKPVKIGDNYYYVWPESKVPVKCSSI